jgi:hypothetical protein
LPYTPFVWHSFDTGGTLVRAVDLNRMEQGIAAASDGVDSLTGQADPAREFAPENFGATGDGVAIDRDNVQAAIDAAAARYGTTGVRQTVPITRAYLLDSIPYTKTDGTVFGAVSLMLKDGVILAGTGTLKVKNGAYGSGAFYAAIRSASSGLSNAGIRDITIDGNKAGNSASTQCSNIVLEAKADIDVTNVRSVNANGHGIMVRGSTATAATNIRIRGCYVTAATGIGIQSSQFDGLDIDNNTVVGCGNNGIDIYGEDGDTAPNGSNFRISNNRVRQTLVGIFLETVQGGIVTGNLVEFSTSSDIHSNRINGEPRHINIAANTCLGSPVGFFATGDSGGLTFRNNTVVGATTAAVQLGAGGGNVSYTYILDNTLNTATLNTQPLVLITGAQASFNRHRGTITKNTDRSKDTVVTATTVVSNVSSPANAA